MRADSEEGVPQASRGSQSDDTTFRAALPSESRLPNPLLLPLPSKLLSLKQFKEGSVGLPF